MPGAQFQGFCLPQLQTDSFSSRPVVAVALAAASLMAWYVVFASRPSTLPPHQSTLT